MPLTTKILIGVFAFALTFPYWLARWQDTTRTARRRRDPYPKRPVSAQRMKRLWVVDRDSPKPHDDPDA